MGGRQGGGEGASAGKSLVGCVKYAVKGAGDVYWTRVNTPVLAAVVCRIGKIRQAAVPAV